MGRGRRSRVAVEAAQDVGVSCKVTDDTVVELTNVSYPTCIYFLSSYVVVKIPLLLAMPLHDFLYLSQLPSFHTTSNAQQNRAFVYDPILTMVGDHKSLSTDNYALDRIG